MIRKLLCLLAIFNFLPLNSSDQSSKSSIEPTDEEFIIETAGLSPELRDSLSAFFERFDQDLPFAILVAPDDLLFIAEEDDENYTSFYALVPEDSLEDVSAEMIDFVAFLQEENDELYRLLVQWYLEEIIVEGNLFYTLARDLAALPPAGDGPII